MRKVKIPCIYDAVTGNWLVVCGLTYDDNNEIIEVIHWDGDTYIPYQKGEFVVDEKLSPLHHNEEVI